jgi:hypothetical protein
MASQNSRNSMRASSSFPAMKVEFMTPIEIPAPHPQGRVPFSKIAVQFAS